jgi:hypothetical protein
LVESVRPPELSNCIPDGAFSSPTDPAASASAVLAESLSVEVEVEVEVEVVELVDCEAGGEVAGDESVDCEPPDAESVSARAIAGPWMVPTAAPTPSTTASAPTRPMYLE